MFFAKKSIFILLFLTISLSFSGISYAGLTTSFKGTSPSCLSCHSIEKAGYTGKYLGVDISNSAQDFGDDGLRSFLEDIPIPLMKEAYAAYPLTASDIDNLLAEYKDLTALKAPESVFYKNHALTGVGFFIIGLLFLRFVLYRKRGEK